MSAWPYNPKQQRQKKQDTPDSTSRPLFFPFGPTPGLNRTWWKSFPVCKPSTCFLLEEASLLRLLLSQLVSCMIPVVSFTISFVSIIPCCLFIVTTTTLKAPGILWIGHHNMIFSLINIILFSFLLSRAIHSIQKTSWPPFTSSPALLRGLKGLYNKEYHTALALSNLKEQPCEWAVDCKQVSGSRYIRE